MSMSSTTHDALLGQSDHGPAAGFASPGTDPVYAPIPELEPVHRDLGLRIDIGERTVQGTLTLTLSARVREARTLSLDAVGFEQIVVASQGVDSRYDGNKLHVTLGEALAQGEQTTLTLTWTVRDPMAGLRFNNGGPNGVFAASDHETSRARYWFPCVDHPLVRPTARIKITHQAGLTALSAGELVGTVDSGDGWESTTWQLDQRTPAYLLCVVVGDLVAYEDGAFNGAPLAYYAPKPATAESLRLAFGRTGEMLEYLTAKLDRPLPWPKYFQFAVEGIGGAMENVSLVSWDSVWLMDERYHAEMGWLVDSVNLHEMSHTWFGDRVVCREFAHVWLKESWATYMEGVFIEDTQGTDAFHMHLHEDAISYQGEVESRYARPIMTRLFESGWDMFDHHLYPGGAWRLHMLRCQLGDETFWSGVRSYVALYDEKVADTADFRKEMEKASGTNLNAFFDQWFCQAGYPQLKAKWTEENGTGVLRIEQTQENKEKDIGLFDFPLQVAVEHESGQWTQHSLNISERVAELRMPLMGGAKQIVIDPETRLLHSLDFDPGRDRLIAALKGPHVRGRIHAAQALAESGDRVAIQAIVDAWSTESGWQVRRAWARYLGASPTTAAAHALAKILVLEQEPPVMTVLCASCEKHRDPVLAQALLDWLAVPNRPYRASAHALTALGKQREAAPLDTLLKASFGESWWGWIQRGAMAGLGASGQPEAIPRLREAILDAELPRSVRLAAIPAYAECARMQERPVREAALADLADVSRHPDYGTRMAAGSAIKALGEAAGVGELKGLLQRVVIQDKPRVRKLAEGLAAQDPAADRKALEKMEDRMRKLEARLASLEAR